MQFRVMTATYNKSMSTESPDNIPAIQKKWLADLEQYVKDYPKSSDSAEAMMQLGIAEEFAGDDSNAVKWYGRVAQNFPKVLLGREGRRCQTADRIGRQDDLAQGQDAGRQNVRPG